LINGGGGKKTPTERAKKVQLSRVPQWGPRNQAAAPLTQSGGKVNPSTHKTKKDFLIRRKKNIPGENLRKGSHQKKTEKARRIITGSGKINTLGNGYEGWDATTLLKGYDIAIIVWD